MKALDLYARDITGEANARRRIERRWLILKVGFLVFIGTVTLIWFTV